MTFDNEWFTTNCETVPMKGYVLHQYVINEQNHTAMNRDGRESYNQFITLQ